MEPKRSLPYSQEPATCPYPEPDQSSPRLSIQLLEDLFQHYLAIYAQTFQANSFPHVSPPKLWKHNSRLPYMPHVQPISFFLIWSTE